MSVIAPLNYKKVTVNHAKPEKLTAENEVLSNENDRLRQWIKAKGYDLQSALE